MQLKLKKSSFLLANWQHSFLLIKIMNPTNCNVVPLRSTVTVGNVALARGDRDERREEDGYGGRHGGGRSCSSGSGWRKTEVHGGGRRLVMLQVAVILGILNMDFLKRKLWFVVLGFDDVISLSDFYFPCFSNRIGVLKYLERKGERNQTLI